MVVTSAGKAKVVYASSSGFHTVDMDSGAVQSIYIPPSAVSIVWMDGWMDGWMDRWIDG